MNPGRSYATIRCLLPEDGGCGELLSERVFRRHPRTPDNGHWRLCITCRKRQRINPPAPERLAQARALYEAGAPALEVVDLIGYSSIDAVSRMATTCGWDKAARRAAMAIRRQERTQAAARERARARAEDRRRLAAARNAEHRRALEIEQAAARASMDAIEWLFQNRGVLPRGPVTVRCYRCAAHYTMELRDPTNCPHCGASGAWTPGAWDDVTEEMTA